MISVYRLATYILLSFLLLMTTACSALTVEDAPATMRADLSMNVTEMAVARTAIVESQGSANATAEAAMTSAAELNTLNVALYATMNAAAANGITERRVLQNDGGAMPAEMFDLSSTSLAPVLACPTPLRGQFCPVKCLCEACRAYVWLILPRQTPLRRLSGLY